MSSLNVGQAYPFVRSGEIEAIDDVLEEHGFSGGSGHFKLRSPDGSYLLFRYLFAGTENIAVELIIPELTDPILDIILQIAKAGNLAMTSTTGHDARIYKSSPTEMQLSEWPDAEKLTSRKAMYTWLEDTIGFREIRV